jgi:hypothetical protein
VCFVVVGLTLPAESVLLKALSPSSAQTIAQDWVNSLSSDQVASASDSVQAYPFAYRREIMRRLPPTLRANVWRRHIQNYIDNNPALDDSVKALLYNAEALATPDAFDQPTADTRTQLAIVAEQIKVLVGKDDAEGLFYRLGPRDQTFASAAPISQRIAAFIHARFVVEARSEDCECNSGFGCGEATYCSAGHGCVLDETWPMCGWWWDQVCDGLCSAGFEGA